MWSQFIEVLASAGPVTSIAVIGGFTLLVIVAVWLVTAHMKGDKGKGRSARLTIGNGKVLNLEIDATAVPDALAMSPAERPELAPIATPPAQAQRQNKNRKRRRGSRGRTRK